MLAAVGWIIAGILALVLVALGLAVMFFARAPYESDEQVHRTVAPQGFNLEGMFDRIDKHTKRGCRLLYLERDLRDAEKLMEIEEEAQRLRARYASRQAPYSRDVEDALGNIFVDIDDLKRGV